MPNNAENALINALTDVDALEELIRLGLPPACVPTPKLAEVFDWAYGYFFDSRRRQAPSRAELIASWGSALEVMGAELESEDVQLPTVVSAVKYLKSTHARLRGQDVLMDAATALATADEPDLPGVVATMASRMAALAADVSHTPGAQNAADGLAASVARLEQRRDNPDSVVGFGLGLPAVDVHTGGIKRGELGVVIAPEKVGKSFIAPWATLQHYNAGGAAVLFTLENTANSMYDRLGCMISGIDYTKYQRGEVTTNQIEELRDWVSTHAVSLAERVMVMRPDEAGSTAAAMCRAARLRGADAIVIDQLSHMEIDSQVRYRTEREITKRRMQELVRALPGDGADPLSGLLLSQASRKAAEDAQKTGTLGSHGGAESSEVERAPDLLWGFYQTEDDKACDEARMELLAFRRGPLAKWDLEWQPWRGYIRVRPTLRRPGVL